MLLLQADVLKIMYMQYISINWQSLKHIWFLYICLNIFMLTIVYYYIACSQSCQPVEKCYWTAGIISTDEPVYIYMCNMVRYEISMDHGMNSGHTAENIKSQSKYALQTALIIEYSIAQIRISA